MSFFPPEPILPWYIRLWRRLFPVRVKSFDTVTLPIVLSGYPKLSAKDIVGDRS